MSLRARSLLLVGALLSMAVFPACKPASQEFTSTVEIATVHTFGNNKGPSLADYELKFVDCPGDARKMVRADKGFAACGAKLKKGDRVPVTLVQTYSKEKEGFYSEVTKLADCPMKPDPADEANWESVQACRDLTMTGATVGVHCDRGRGKELVAKCPWFRRK